MSYKIIYDLANFSSKYTPHEYTYNSTFVWGKASKVNEDTFELMQMPVSCKDYVIDTYWQNSSGYCFNKWTDKQRYYPAIYCVLSDPVRMKHLQKMVKNTLNVWEKSFDITPTVCTQITTNIFINKNVCIIEFDSKWMMNATAYSFFLSLIRICTTNTELSFVKSKESQWDCNEYSYYSRLYSSGKTLCNNLLKDPTILFVTPPEPYYRTGFNIICEHGMTGIFNLAYDYQHTISTNNRSYILNNYMNLLFYDTYNKQEKITPKTLIKIQRPRNQLGQFIPHGQH
jgi:hypothetical protein